MLGGQEDASVIEKNLSTNMAKHSNMFHCGDKRAMQVQVIDKIKVPTRGG